MVRLGVLTSVLAAATLAACSGNGAPFSQQAIPHTKQASLRHATSSPIQHVIFIIQENRSFNNMFYKFVGAKTQGYGYDANGNKIKLQPVRLSTTWDINHDSTSFFQACNGTGSLPGTKCQMNGWNKESAGPNAPKNFAYSYVQESDIAPYWAMAKHYVLADHMFPSNLDGSFIAHQYAIAAYASRGVDYPSQGTWGCGGGIDNTIYTLNDDRSYGAKISPCFDNPTIASEADSAGLSWRFYADGQNSSGGGGIWSAYRADDAVYNGPEWKSNVISPPSQFVTDVGNGYLANITWITPSYSTSDHPGFQAGGGPAWVTSLVNAVGKSRFWKTSAIFIMWDDPGGWFDPVKPPFKDYDGLGFRVPLIVISPYAKQGYVTHVQYETASVLRFMEDTFGLGQLNASDKRSNDFVGDALDYSQPPRQFKKFAGAMPRAYWTKVERADAGPPPKAMIGDD